MKSWKILLIQADTTQSLPIATSLSKMGHEVHAVVSSKLSYAYGSRFIKKKFIFKDYQDIDAHYCFVNDILKSDKYDFIIPMADDGASMISKYKTELLKLASFKIPDYDTFLKGYDKHRLMEICALNNVPHPKTVSIEKDCLNLDIIKTLRFPILIKPNISCGARGITYVESIDALLEKFPSVYALYGKSHLQEFIPKGGAQVEVQLYINEKKELVQGSVIYKYRWYPNNGGSSCCNKSINHTKIIDICYNLLKEIDWVGFADFDTIEDPRTGELLIMELNPRVPACVKTSFEAGFNWADVIVSEYANVPHKKYSFKKTVFLRHLGFEVLWFLNSPSRFKAKPSWFKFFGKNIYYQDMNGWYDPLPFIYGTLGNIIKQLSPSFRKSKAGI